MSTGKNVPDSANLSSSASMKTEALTETDRLLRRAQISLEDGEFKEAYEFCEHVLNLDPENAEAYVIMLYAELGVTQESELANQPVGLADMPNYRRAVRFADPQLRERLEGYEKLQQERLTKYREYAVKCCAYAPDQCRVSHGLNEKALLREDGTLLIYDDANERIGPANAEDAASLNDMAAVSTGYSFDGQFGGGHVVGLKKNGTVVAVGANSYGQCDVSDWAGIVSITAGNCFTVGVEFGGMVVTTGKLAGRIDGAQLGMPQWTDIVSVAIGLFHVVGLQSDGTVIANGYDKEGQCDVDHWHDIVAVSAGKEHTVGLKADGTVVAAGGNGDGQCNVSAWRNIIAVSAGSLHTVGLQADGTVVATGQNSSGQCDISGWRGILAISAGCYHTMGLKEDLADGEINYVITGEQSTQQELQSIDEDFERQRYRRELGLCPYCGGTPSLLTRKCKSCGQSCR